ncbi:MAG: Ig-like domain-containing protein [Desulfamplus sp.]|nr:Ig-like domain-containing protein [Desulfamplus sp.]
MKKSLMVFVYWLTLFAITLSGTNVYSASKYEAEPNESRISATEMTFGDKIVGNMWHALDYDWYSIVSVPAGIVSLTAYYDFPSGATADTANLYVEVRDVSNKVLSDFFIDYRDYKTNTPYIRDINIPDAGTYYIVVHCPSQAKFKRDRYYITMAKGAGENAKVSILNEEDSVKVTADEKSTETITALVVDEDGNPVEGALVKFSSLNPDDKDLVFSQGDIKETYSNEKGYGNTGRFSLFAGEKKMEFQYTNTKFDYVKDNNGNITSKSPVPTYFRVELYNFDNPYDKMDLYSVTTDGSVQEQVAKQILSDGDYYLLVEVGQTDSKFDGIWQVTIPNSKTGGKGDEIGTAVTNSSGIAEFTYKSTYKKGDFTIIASFGNNSDNFKIKQVAGVPAKVEILDLVDDPENTLLYINREYGLQVKVTDKNGNLVEDEDNIEVNLSSATGLKINEFPPTVKTKNGMAKFTISASSAKEYILTASIKADSSINDTLTVKFNTISLSNMMAQPVYMLADGKNTSTISVRLNDSNGMAVSDEPINFTTICGTLLTNTAKTDTNGIAQVILLSPFKSGICTVTAAYGTAKLTTPVEFYGDGFGTTTASIDLKASSNTVSANGKSSVVLEATLTDNAGQPVAAGTSVQFTTDKGMFLNGSQEFKGTTPAGGVVKASLITRPEDTAGKANITCSSGGITQSIQITFTAVNSDGSAAGESTAYIKLSAAPTTIPADGKSSLMVTAELSNSKGGAVPAGTEIAFYASNGTFANGVLENGVSRFTAATTDDAGKVYVALISSATTGPVDVWCLSNGVYQLTTVTFKGSGTATDVGIITLTANPASIPANGSSSASITADIKDRSGNPVPAGTSVTFSTTTGTFSSTSTTTQSITVTTPDNTGKVIVSLISSTTAGFATITATSGAAKQSTLVTFEGGANPNIGSILLTANPDSVTADGSSSTSGILISLIYGVFVL